MKRLLQRAVMPVSTLTVHIGRVLFRCSEEQVIRANTRRIVAAMTDQKFTGWSACRFVRESMRAHCSTVIPELSVSSSPANSALPYPTAVALLCVGRESRYRIGKLCGVGAVTGAVDPDLRDVIRHRLAALRARLRDLLRSNTCAAVGVTAMGAEAAHFATAAKRDGSADYARALDFSFKRSSVHTRSLYSMVLLCAYFLMK